MLLRFCALCLFALPFYSCETEVDLNAPYESYTTVYGILDLSADTQVVRINKSFLGEGSAYDFAQVKDSSEYEPDEVEAYITFWNDTAFLEPHYVDREPGVFYDSDVLVFITTEELAVDAQGNELNLNIEAAQLPNEYKLVVNVKGKTITGTTEPTYLQESFSITDPHPSLPAVDWGETTEEGDEFILKTMGMESVPPGELYQAKIIFHYSDHYMNGDVVARSIEFNLGTEKVPVGSTPQDFDRSYSPENILTTIANNADCNGIAYRTLEQPEFVMIVAGEDLSRFISVNNPVTGVVTERPEFSNVEGENAIGLFSSRYKLSIFKDFEGSTREMIFTGETTGQYCFCVEGPGSSFPCPDINTECNCN